MATLVPKRSLCTRIAASEDNCSAPVRTAMLRIASVRLVPRCISKLLKSIAVPEHGAHVMDLLGHHVPGHIQADAGGDADLQEIHRIRKVLPDFLTPSLLLHADDQVREEEGDRTAHGNQPDLLRQRIVQGQDQDRSGRQADGEKQELDAGVDGGAARVMYPARTSCSHRLVLARPWDT